MALKVEGKSKDFLTVLPVQMPGIFSRWIPAKAGIHFL